MIVEENVKMGVANVCKSDTVQAAWADPNKKLFVHGWVYEIEKGTIKDLGISQGS